MPASFIFNNWFSTVSFVEDTHVRCAIELTPYASFISFAIFIVCLLVPPPAPYVTLIKSGFSADISLTASITLSNAVVVLGGKTSIDNVTLLSFNNSVIFI